VTNSGPLQAFTTILRRDLRGVPQPLGAPREHLLAAADWLGRAQDHGGGGGVSYGFSLRKGWRPPYRETSGYIAETYFDLAEFLDRPDFRERALCTLKWLCTVQNDDGSISNPRFDAAKGIVFDTGMVLHGLVRGYTETGDEALLLAAERAADWLTTVAREDGRWTRNEYRDTPHVYNTRTAWAVLRLHEIRRKAAWESVARANLDWALAERTGGYYSNNAFVSGDAPYTHNIAYAIRGLLESGALLGEERYVAAAENSACTVIDALGEDGFLPGTIDVSGKPQATYCCLTGNVQMSGIWAKLYRRNGDKRFKDAATNSLRYVMGWQDIQTTNANVRGAIKGSQPVWGKYSPMTFPNWATKFFIDAMILSDEWLAA
jgi:uncharacterized protein YyaL (SSP411 family)